MLNSFSAYALDSLISQVLCMFADDTKIFCVVQTSAVLQYELDFMIGQFFDNLSSTS